MQDFCVGNCLKTCIMFIDVSSVVTSVDIITKKTQVVNLLLGHSVFILNGLLIGITILIGFCFHHIEPAKKLANESPVAWPYGPVFPSIFNYINSNNIDYGLEKKDLSNNIANLLDKVVKAFGSYRASVLSAWSHKKDSPWDVVVNKMGSKLGTLIPDGVIEKYFRDNVVRT